MLGGRKTPQGAGLKLAFRDQIYARISQLDAGTLFRQEEVSTADEAADFVDMRDYDYVHVFDGHYTGVLEGRYVRQLPDIRDVMASYARLRGVTLSETGDRLAWDMKLKEFEPLDGYRFYSTGADELLTLGHMKIRVMKAPDWLRNDTPEATLFRIFYDLHPKDRPDAVRRALAPGHFVREDLKSAAEFGLALPATDAPEGRVPPEEVARDMLELLAPRKAEAEA